ncbi:MAG: hypothetical protein ABIU54_07600, partial [Candidatus Eisenbacteria bacterium]
MNRFSHAALDAALFMLVTASCLLGLSGVSFAQSGVWSEVIAPPTVRSALAIYDPVRDQLVRACGSSPWAAAPFEQTWVLSLTTHQWSQLPATLPGMLSGSAIYDPLRDRMLAVGYTGGAVNARCWTLPLANPSSWTERSVAGVGPTSPAQEGSILYDSVADRVITLRYNDNGLIETRCISLAGPLTWSLLATTNAPPSRSGMTCVFDPVRYAVWVFAGEVAQMHGSGLRNEVWKLDLRTNAWTLIAFAGQQPSVRKDHVAIYDPVSDRMLTFGGNSGLADTWQLTLSGTPEWTPIGTAAPPPGRALHSAIYDSQRGAMIVTGGAGAGQFNDTWSLNLSGAPAWTDIAPGGTLAPGRVGQSSAFDVLRNRMTVFGGYDGTQLSNEVRELDRAGEPQWRVIT